MALYSFLIVVTVVDTVRVIAVVTSVTIIANVAAVVIIIDTVVPIAKQVPSCVLSTFGRILGQ